MPLPPRDPAPDPSHTTLASHAFTWQNPTASLRNLFRPDYFKSGCEQQPSPSARETRPPDQTTRARLSLSAHGFRGVGQGGRSTIASET
jgi:hypothetical protein